MLLAFGAASTALSVVQSLTSSSSSPAPSSGFDQGSANPFEVASPAPASPSSVSATGFSAGSQISPATMSELLAAQSSGTDPGSDPAGATAPTSATSSYQSLGQLFQREAQAISFSVAPLSFNA